MDRKEALRMIVEALEKTKPGAGNAITEETHLVDEKIIDSLDSMNFLFELETAAGKKFDQIDETFDDFRVSTLIDIVSSS